MNRVFRDSLLVNIIIASVASLVSTPCIAEEIETANLTTQELAPMAQVTSVSQLSDVQPTDWAFQALQSLVERYGCIAGYPDNTYRGNRALTRYEFAALLNACLDRVNELIATASNNLTTKADLVVLERLQAEFAAELASLNSRVDALEATTAQLEANQFSTTTKLNAEVIFAPSYAFGDDLDDNFVLQSRARLNFDTSFTGKDRLRMRLEGGNFQSFSYNVNITNEAQLSFDTGTNNDVILSDLSYSFPIGEKINVFLLATGGEHDDYLNLIDPILFSSGKGAISRFGLFNPVYNFGGQSAGVIVEYQFTETMKLSLDYLAGEAEDPGESNGLFNGTYSALARLEYRTKLLALSVVYINSYDEGGLSLETGSFRARVDIGRPVVGNSYGFQASISPSSKFRISGWVGFTDAVVIGRGTADIWNYALIVDFPDLGKEGNLLAFVIGQEPKLTGTSGFTVLGRRNDPDTSLHVEALYRHQLTDNISVTPGVIWLTAPGHDNNNSDIVVGTIRTTFQF